MTRLLTLLFLCLVAGVSGYWLAVRPTTRAELVDYLPEDPLALIECDNFARSWEQWQRRLDGEKTPRPHYFKILAQVGIPAAFLDDSRKAIDFLEHYSRRPGFYSLLSTHAVLALFPESGSQLSVPPPLAKQWVLALQLPSDFSLPQFQEFFGSVQSQQTVIYQGESLVTLVFQDGQTLFYWIQRGVVLCAREVTLVQRCIDQSLQRMVRARSGLHLNPVYQRLRQHGRNRTDVFCYADLEKLQRWVPMLREIDTETGGLVPRQLALFHLAETEQDRVGVIAVANKEAVAAFTSQHQLASPISGPISLPMGTETGFSLWTNWFNPQRLWDFGLQRAHPEVVALMTAVGQQLAEITGKPLDAFFHVFGSGFGVFINEQVVPHQSNRSMGCVILEVRDRAAVATMIKQLVAGLQVITVKSGETEIASVMLAGGLVQPAYTLVDNYLFLADSVELIEQALQQIKRDQGSGEKAHHGTEGGGGNLFLFVRTGEMSERLFPLLTQLAKETGERTRILSPENRRLVREVGLPLLTSLRGIGTSRFRGYVADDTILFEVDYTLRRQ